jgi:uncharacterized membrane protein YeiB
LGLLWRRVRLWGWIGGLLLAGLIVMTWVVVDQVEADAASVPRQSFATMQTYADWGFANATQYAIGLIGTLFASLPFCYAVVLGGVFAGRLQLLHHRRWRAHWQRWAQGAPWLLALNLAYGVLVAVWLRTDVPKADALAMLQFFLGPLTVMTWVPWLLLRGLPQWLSDVGRNTLTVYIASSITAVAVLAGVGLGWQPGTVAGTCFALLVWLALAAWSAQAARQGRRLPLEVLMARKRLVG